MFAVVCLSLSPLSRTIAAGLFEHLNTNVHTFYNHSTTVQLCFNLSLLHYIDCHPVSAYSSLQNVSHGVKKQYRSTSRIARKMLFSSCRHLRREGASTLLLALYHACMQTLAQYRHSLSDIVDVHRSFGISSPRRHLIPTTIDGRTFNNTLLLFDWVRLYT